MGPETHQVSVSGTTDDPSGMPSSPRQASPEVTGGMASEQGVPVLGREHYIAGDSGYRKW